MLLLFLLLVRSSFNVGEIEGLLVGAVPGLKVGLGLIVGSKVLLIKLLLGLDVIETGFNVGD